MLRFGLSDQYRTAYASIKAAIYGAIPLLLIER